MPLRGVYMCDMYVCPLYEYVTLCYVVWRKADVTQRVGDAVQRYNERLLPVVVWRHVTCRQHPHYHHQGMYYRVRQQYPDWLPITQRIHYKIATITYWALLLQQPTYISTLLVNYFPPRTLHSASQGLLDVPGSRTVIGARRFSCAAPLIWNNLPYNVRSAGTIGTFRTRLKTHLFPIIA